MKRQQNKKECNEFIITIDTCEMLNMMVSQTQMKIMSVM